MLTLFEGQFVNRFFMYSYCMSTKSIKHLYVGLNHSSCELMYKVPSLVWEIVTKILPDNAFWNSSYLLLQYSQIIPHC